MGIHGFNSREYSSLSDDEKEVYKREISNFHNSKMDAVKRKREEEEEETLVIEVDQHLAITEALETRIKELEEELAVYVRKEREAEEAKQRQLEEEHFNKQLEEKKKVWFSPRTDSNRTKKSEVTPVEDIKEDVQVLDNIEKVVNLNFF